MSDTFAPPVGDSSMFGSTITMLKDAGTGARQTHDVIANNVANINTPGFKRTDVSFKEALASELPRYDDPDDLALATDDDRQIQAGPDFDPKPFAVTTSIAPSRYGTTVQTSISIRKWPNCR